MKYLLIIQTGVISQQTKYWGREMESTIISDIKWITGKMVFLFYLLCVCLCTYSVCVHVYACSSMGIHVYDGACIL